ncbi:hypothetical protein BC629DRAFT_1463074 [Irpex lacteus]|nr:hypothetical protein BC629DRAFT_1463074 [Irpex lacteus]
MGAPSTSAAQWLFPISSLVEQTPSRTTSSIPVEKELYDRARGVEFLFRLGTCSSLYTAATWFHRFYMRFSMEDYHRQVTEECGRKLKDVARIDDIADDRIEDRSLLEALCFDFVVRSPHADLVDLLEARQETIEFEEYAFSIANDSTPLCVLHSPRIIAVACYVLAQQYLTAPSASLPTPPSNKPPYPESTRFAVEFCNLNETEL